MTQTTKWAVMAALATAGALGAQAQVNYLGLYNVIVSGNLNTSSDVQGEVVADNYTNGNTASLAQNVSVSASQPTVYLEGSVTSSGSGITVQNGSLALGPSASLNGRSVTFNQTGAGVQTGSSFNFSAVFNGVATQSTTYATPSNISGSVNAGTVTPSGNNLSFNIPSNAAGKVLFFSVAAGNLGQQNQTISLNNPNNVTPLSIIINVTGATSYTEGGGVNYSGLFSTSNTDPWMTKTLWNFNGFTSLSLNGWQGSLLAPGASVNLGSSIMYGSVAAANLTTQAEIHLPTWSGVPEPSTYAAGLALTGMIGWRWMRRGRAKS